MIIGISGKMGTGKSHLSKLVAEKDNSFQIISFATPLKEYVANLYNLSIDIVKTDKNFLVQLSNNKKVSLRYLLQYYGQKFRDIDEDYWVKRLFEKIEPDKNYLIDDVRFKNEVERIKLENGVCVRIEPYPEWDFYSEDISETNLDDYPDFDLVICPNFGELSKFVDAIIDLKKRRIKKD